MTNLFWRKLRQLWKMLFPASSNWQLSRIFQKEKVLEMIIEECNRAWHLKPSVSAKKSNIPDVDATALIYNINLSTNQFQMIRTLCLPHNVVFPIRNKIDSMKKTFHPPINSCQLKYCGCKMCYLMKLPVHCRS